MVWRGNKSFIKWNSRGSTGLKIHWLVWLSWIKSEEQENAINFSAQKWEYFPSKLRLRPINNHKLIILRQSLSCSASSKILHQENRANVLRSWLKHDEGKLTDYEISIPSTESTSPNKTVHQPTITEWWRFCESDSNCIFHDWRLCNRVFLLVQQQSIRAWWMDSELHDNDPSNCNCNKLSTIPLSIESERGEVHTKCSLESQTKSFPVSQ